MPTLILLDVSLSMARSIESTEEGGVKVIDLASKFILNIVDHLSLNYNQEYVSLVVFSSLYEVVVKFTRDYDLLRKACDNFQIYDKTVYESTLHGIESIVNEEWGKTVAINLILITDGLCGIGDGSLKDSLSTASSRKYENRFPFPFAFPCHFTAVCLAPEQELNESRKLFEHLISLNYDKGELLIPDSLNEIGLTQCFGRLVNLHYKRFETILKCGHFQSHVTLSPAPKFQNTYCNILNFYKHPEDETDTLKLKIGLEMEIIGFLDLIDFGNPPFISRHLILPLNSDESKPSTPSKNKEKDSAGHQPSFCVLLHGSLKMEKMGAVVKLSDDWYGMLYSWSDSKKKSNLMLSVFEPGHPFPWVGDISYLGPAQEIPVHASRFDSKENAEDNPFPVLPDIKHSYQTQCNAVWIKSSGLQSDIQKLLRYARKLPDKQSAFFKEVNKIRRAGMMYGFYDLLNALADALENEGSHMKPEVVVQLRHVAEGLRNAPSRDVNTNILAINTFRKKSES